MCNMDLNSDFDVCADVSSDYESDISSDSNFEGLDTVDDSSYKSFDEVGDASSEVEAETDFDLAELKSVDDTGCGAAELTGKFDSLEALNDAGNVESVENEAETDLGSLEEIEADDLSLSEDKDVKEVSLEELPLNELDEAADDCSPKVLTRDITSEIIESRNSDTEETLENYRDNLREYGVAEEEIDKFVEQEREKINAEYASLDSGDTNSDIYYPPTDWEEVADSLMAEQKLQDITSEEMEKMDLPQDKEPKDFTLQHNPETDDFDLVSQDDHSIDDDTGGNDLRKTGEAEPALDNNDIQSDAEKAADYARSYGFDKAADYIERHYAGDEFIPGNPIPITTRNRALDGLEAENGVPFERRTAELTDGLSVEGVFPKFDSKHHVELGSDANDMSIRQQFSACKEDFQDHMYDSPAKLQGITFGEMERMDLPQGYTPEGYTWQHNPETGSFDLVSRDEHSVGHTGGNALWGKLERI